jgi:hypothetical protein
VFIEESISVIFNSLYYKLSLRLSNTLNGDVIEGRELNDLTIPLLTAKRHGSTLMAFSIEIKKKNAESDLT